MNQSQTTQQTERRPSAVVRWLLFLSTFFVCVLALVQIIGRVGMQFVDDFEPQVNQLLERQNITVQGLQGDWHGLNPILRVQRVELPAGELLGIDLELDLFETLMRGAVVLRAGHLSDGQLAVARVAGQWQLVGMPPRDEPIDVSTLLQHSDSLVAGVTIHVLGRADEKPYTARINGKLSNLGGVQKAEGHIAVEACSGCEVVARYEAETAVPLLREIRRELHVEVRQLPVPSAVFGDVGGGGTLDTIQIDAVQQGAVTRGRLLVAATNLRVAGTTPTDVSVAGSLIGTDTHANLAFSELEVTTNDSQLDLADLRITSSRTEGLGLPVDGSADWEIVLALADRPAGPIIQHLSKLLAEVKTAGAWLRELAITGDLHNLRGLARRDHDGRWRVGYGAEVSAVDMQGYKGAPSVRNAAGRVTGDHRRIAMQVASNDFWIQFPDTFKSGWSVARAGGQLQGYFRPGYFGLRGFDFDLDAFQTKVGGHFALASPHFRRYDKRLSIYITADQVGVADGKTFVPYKVSPRLLDWTQTAPLGGLFSGAQFAYQGQVHERKGELGRRIALTAQVQDASVRFQPDWPIVSGVDGQVFLRGRLAQVETTRAQSHDIDLAGSRVEVVDNGDHVGVRLKARGDGAQVLSYVRSSPLQDYLAFVQPDWQVDGGMYFNGLVTVPLRSESQKVLDVQFDAQLVEVAAELPEYRVRFEGLNGAFNYALPHRVRATGIQGRLWGEPVSIDLSHDDERALLAFSGAMSVPRVYQMLLLDDLGLARGSFGYQAQLAIPAQPGTPVTLALNSDLVGVEVLAPTGLGKPASESRALQVTTQFLSRYTTSAFEYPPLNGWVHIDDGVERGAVGLDVSPPMVAMDESVVRIAGRIDEVELDEWVGVGSGDGLPFAWELADVAVGRFSAGTFSTGQLTLSGSWQPDAPEPALQFRFDSTGLGGSASVPADDLPITLQLSHIHLSAGESGDDPLDADVARSLPVADVRIAEVHVGDEDFGAWQFDVRKPSQDVVLFANLIGELKGIRLSAEEGLLWNGADNTSRVTASVSGGDLSTILPQWGYAASLTSEEMALAADVAWTGSPLNFEVVGLDGSIGFSAANGRFVDIESGSGTLRMLSLMNFTTVFKRLNLNFSDVVGKGVSFENLEARVGLQQGRLSFTDPMQISSTASDFQVGGVVNLHTGELNNDLIVTLPVSKGLPWYGVYVALANPLAGLGVVLGERVLRKPIQQFSSARYAIRGTLDEPDVRFVQLFDTKVRSGEEIAEEEIAEEPISEESGYDIPGELAPGAPE